MSRHRNRLARQASDSEIVNEAIGSVLDKNIPVPDADSHDQFMAVFEQRQRERAANTNIAKK